MGAEGCRRKKSRVSEGGNCASGEPRFDNECVRGIAYIPGTICM